MAVKLKKRMILHRRRPTRPVDVRRAGQSSSGEAQAVAIMAARAGLEKKALNVDIVAVEGRVDYADYIVLMTGQSDRHVAAIARSVDDEARRTGNRPVAVEGLPQAQWVLIDLVDVVVHVFREDARHLYDLDGLWMDARRIPVPREESAGELVESELAP